MSSLPTATHSSPRPQARELLRSASPALLLAIAAALAFPSGTASAQQAAPLRASQCPAEWAPVPAGVNPALRCLPSALIASLPEQQSPPARGCPSGWQPVSSSVNPVLRCLPARLTIDQGTRAGSASGCPAGWTTVAPGVNPLLRCLPDDIAAIASRSRSQRAASSECPKGWKPVAPGVNPVMRCVPGTIAMNLAPLQGGPGTGDPGQGRDSPKAQSSGPDLALTDTFQVGPASMEWGSSASLPASAAAFRKKGACGFRFLHRTRNQGVLGTTQTVNRIHRDTQGGPVLAKQPLPALAPGAEAASDGHIMLKPGTWMLYVHADAPDVVAEADESNNLRRVRVTVTGNCKG
ncbi:MAG: hypothetical protein M3Q42_03480 [Pseudomonadota bacterium]|nr:hypothetical protein [Pseudomonadota bacterium]